MTDPNDDPDFNPYRPPSSDPPRRRIVARAPGWLILLFGLAALLLWDMDRDGWDLGGSSIANNLNALMYGVPAGIGALVFGIGNLSAGRHRATSLLGVLLAGAGLVGGFVQVYRMIR